ncbi:MAG TPA: copper-binding protein [Polyangiales bacterium]
MLCRLATTLSFSFATLCLLCACDADKEPVQSYHVRGLVQDLSGSGADARVTIHHEAVARFKDRDGHASDMASMKMIFGFGPKLSAADVKVGDKIAFDFDVRWSESPTLVVTRLQKLAPDVALSLAGEP